MLKLIALVSGLLFSLPLHANTVPNDIQAQLKAPGKVGEVQVRFLGIRMYRAALFTKEGIPFNWNRPFALELKYARSFGKDRLVNASISELERLEGKRKDHAAIARKLGNCYRNVSASDRFVAVPKGRNSVQFFFNGRKTCSLNHAGVRERVLGIWLSDRSRDKRLSRVLRGLN